MTTLSTMMAPQWAHDRAAAIAAFAGVEWGLFRSGKTCRAPEATRARRIAAHILHNVKGPGGITLSLQATAIAMGMDKDGHNSVRSQNIRMRAILDAPAGTRTDEQRKTADLYGATMRRLGLSE